MPVSLLSAGDWVVVRSREEILATLDEKGRLDGMPFMPEMLAYCGKTLQVSKRAHKTCDTISYSGARRLERTVHLQEARCNGLAHGGCEAACSLYWNEAWLKPATGADVPARSMDPPPSSRQGGCSMQQLDAATRQGDDADKGERYACQATELLQASRPMSSWNMGQYVEDYRCGNVRLATLAHGTLYRVTMYVVRRAERLDRYFHWGDRLARAVMAGYDGLQRLLPNGVPFPRRKGTIPQGQPTPQTDIGNLGPGSMVRVKTYGEILATLDSNNKTRGLYFDAEHVPYCGKEFVVRSLVHRIIDERTGYMLRFKTPSIILENVYCQGVYSDNRMFCPRAIYPYWRPIWLKPVEREQPCELQPAAAIAGMEKERQERPERATQGDPS